MEHLINLNFAPGGLPATVHVSQYDDTIRQLRFQLWFGRSKVEVPSGASVRVDIKKPDGHIVLVNGTVNSSDRSIVTVPTTKQMTAVPGGSRGTLVVSSTGDKRISSAIFILQVHRDPVEDGDASDSDLSMLQDAIDQTAANASAAQAAATAAQQAASSFTTDTTLSVSGKAADAAETGRQFGLINESLDDVRADLSNIKPGLSDDAKLALMACFEQVAWKKNLNTNVYLQALATALEIGIRIISGSDLGNYGMWYTAYPYYASNNARLAYTKLDIPVTGGKIYAIKANTNQSNVNMRIDIYNENVLARAANEENISQSDHQLATGDWNALEQTIVMPKMINDSPTAGIICIVRYSDDSNINVGAIDSIVIQEKSVGTVPMGYTEYDYIAVSGTSSVMVDATAVIQTAVYDDLGHANISLDYLATNSLETSNIPIIGVRGESDWAHTICIYITSGKDYTVHSHGSKVISDAVTKNKINHIDLKQGNASPSIVVANGSKTEITWSQDNTVYGSMYLFVNAVYNVTTSFQLSANVRLGQFVIWEADGEPDVYVPVVRNSDNVIGIYNVTKQKFYTCSDTTKAKVGHSNCLYQVGNWQ